MKAYHLFIFLGVMLAVAACKKDDDDSGCDTVGDTQCDGNILEICAGSGSSGGMFGGTSDGGEWEESMNCADYNMGCQETMNGASCGGTPTTDPSDPVTTPDITTTAVSFCTKMSECGLDPEGACLSDLLTGASTASQQCIDDFDIVNNCVQSATCDLILSMCESAFTAWSESAACNTGTVDPPVAGTWICSESYYGSDDGCECGCGIVDPDCLGITADFCEYYDGCSDGNSALINPTNNALCL